MAFYITDLLQKALNDRNMSEIRYALLGYIEKDPAFRTEDFWRGVEEVRKRGFQDVFEENDPSLFRDCSKNLKEQYAEVKGHLFMNFSESRVHQLEEIGKCCMQDAVVYSITSSARPSSETGTGKGKPGKKVPDQDWKRTGMIAAAAVLVILIVGILLFLELRK